MAALRRGNAADVGPAPSRRPSGNPPRRGEKAPMNETGMTHPQVTNAARAGVKMFTFNQIYSPGVAGSALMKTLQGQMTGFPCGGAASGAAAADTYTARGGRPRPWKRRINPGENCQLWVFNESLVLIFVLGWGCNEPRQRNHGL